MNASLALLLMLMPAAAAGHHDRAMEHYRAGRHTEALGEFRAAYAAMADPRGHRDDREMVLGTMRGMMLVEHEQTGAPRPLCELQTLLGEHIAALRAAYPESPELPEIVGGEAQLSEVAALLASFPADACQPEPPPAETTPEPEPPAPARPTAPAPEPAPAVAPPPPKGPTTRQLRVAGGVTLGVGGALLSVMAYGIADERRHAAAARRTDREVVGDITPDQHAALVAEREQARASRNLAIATGCTAAAAAVLGTTLLIVARKRHRAPASRVSVAPWWLSSGTGVSLRVLLR